jgi:hypothetical protein
MSTHGGTSTSAPPATTVTGPDAIGAPAVVGTGLHYARNDHDHGLPALDYNAMQYNDLLGWTFDPAAMTLYTYTYSAAHLTLERIPLPASITVTNILILGANAGVSLTNSFVGLYQSNGTILGQSADQSTAWESANSSAPIALVGGPYVCTPLAANDFLWVAYYVGTAVTMPSFYSAGVEASLPAMTAARTRFGKMSLANTATLPSITPANIQGMAGTGIQPVWMAIS